MENMGRREGGKRKKRNRIKMLLSFQQLFYKHIHLLITFSSTTDPTEGWESGERDRNSAKV